MIQLMRRRTFCEILCGPLFYHAGGVAPEHPQRLKDLVWVVASGKGLLVGLHQINLAHPARASGSGDLSETCIYTSYIHTHSAISFTLLASPCCLVSSDGDCSVAATGVVAGAVAAGATPSLFSSEARMELCSS